MCLAAFSIGQHERFPLVLAANRDEFFARPAAPVQRWSPDAGRTWIVSGIDLEGGGTWLGLRAGRGGRLALLTNVREGGPAHGAVAAAPSRGGIVTDWLTGDGPFESFWNEHRALPYNGFNVIAAELDRCRWYWGSNRAESGSRLEMGLYGLSNAALDTPWPKVSTLKQRVGQAVDAGVTHAWTVAQLADSLLTALSDRAIAPDDTLPSTGIALERERQLSAAYIDDPAGRYGTRCSTVVALERSADGALVAHVFERTTGESTARYLSALIDAS